MEQTQKQKNGFMMKLATFIVDKRNLFLLITIILLVFSAFSRNWVEVENDQTAYLPASATRSPRRSTARSASSWSMWRSSSSPC